MSVSLEPVNQNLAQVTKFQLNFDRIPYVTFFCQTATLPGLSIKPQVRSTSFIELFLPGNKLTYGNFDVTYVIDEDYRSWESIHDWLRGMAFPTNFKEYVDLQRQTRHPNISFTNNMNIAKDNPQYSDATLTVYTNKNNPHIRYRFKDCFPVSMTEVQLDNTKNADTVLTVGASFKFSYYDVNRL